MFNKKGDDFINLYFFLFLSIYMDVNLDNNYDCIIL